MRRGLLLLILLARVASAQSVGDQLRAEIGGKLEVAILPSSEGLVAVSADGARRRALVPGNVTRALVDDAAQVVWYAQPARDAQDLYLLDLTAAAIAPVLVLRGAPARDGLDIVHGDTAWLVSDPPQAPAVVFDFRGKSPALTDDDGILANWPWLSKKHARAIRRLKVSPAGTKLLARLAARAHGRQAKPDKTPPPPAGAFIPEAKLHGVCEDDSCGNVAAVPATRYWAVITSHTCGDGCYTTELLYDPAAREFFTPGRKAHGPALEHGGEIHEAWIAPSGNGYVSDGALISFDRGVIIAPPGDAELHGGGWLGGSFYLP